MDFAVQMESKLQNTHKPRYDSMSLIFYETFKRTYLGTDRSCRVHRQCKLKVLMSAIECILQFEHLLLFNFRKTRKIENFKKLTNMTQNGKKAQIFYHAHHPDQIKKKMSVAKLNSVGWFLRNRCWYEIWKNQEKLINATCSLHINEIIFKR